MSDRIAGGRRGIWLAAAAALYLFGWAEAAHAYIGPGAGFAALGSALFLIVAVALTVFALLTWPIRYLIGLIRGRKAYGRSRVKRLVILGLDGLDPRIVEEMMAQGRLPHLKRLGETGSFQRLASTCPAISPVAWSSFMTGANPGRHAIFDFLLRNPRTYLPDLSSAEVLPPRRALKVGRWRIPLGGPRIRLLRKGKPFWMVLGEHGVFSTVLRVPITFPPDRFFGHMVAGMCVPDLRGTQGSFTLFATGDSDARHTGGERIRAERNGQRITASLPGPPDPSDAEGRPLTLPLTVSLNGDGRATLEINGARIALERGRYSEWVPLTFNAGPGMKVGGACRFLLRQSEPELELYTTPINVDPSRPALPVSHPFSYAVYLAKTQGCFATLGLAEDTWALNEHAIDDEAFLDQTYLIYEERRRMFLDALGHTRRGVVVCVFDTTDRIQHMFWRYRDPAHPARGNGSERGRGAIEEVYAKADELVGETMARLGAKDALIVMSDHGFTSFARGVNLNAWLREHGYLAMKEGERDGDWFRAVDWSRTRAYALGLGGIYLNLKGREAQGIVDPEEAPALKRELIEGLSGLKDPATGAVAINEVFDAREIYTGPYLDNGFDLVAGYNSGYRASWDGATGKVGGPLVEDNTRAWSGDHCVDPREVPGVLFTSEKIEAESPQITDIAPTALAYFGIAAPRYMDGRSLLGEM